MCYIFQCKGDDQTGPITLGWGRALRTNASSRRWCKSASSCGWCKSADLNISVDCLFHWIGPFFNAANEFVSCFKCSCSSCQAAQNVNTGNPNMAASVGNTSNQLALASVIQSASSNIHAQPNQLLCQAEVSHLLFPLLNNAAGIQTAPAVGQGT